MKNFNNPFAGLEKKIADKNPDKGMDSKNGNKSGKSEEAIDVIKTLEKAHLGRMISDLAAGKLGKINDYRVAIESHRDIDDQEIFLTGLTDVEKEKVAEMQREVNAKIDEDLQKLIAQSWEPLKERFHDITDDRMGHIPDGWSFKSLIPGVDSISVMKSAPDKGFFIDIGYKDKNGKSTRKNFSLFPDGTLSGELPRDLTATKQQIYAEILDVLDSIGLDFWYDDKEKILEDHDWPMPLKEEIGGAGAYVPTDRRRIEFLQKQPDSIFGFSARLNEYKAFVFKNFIVLENPRCENAAFFIDFPEGTELSQDEIGRCDTHTGRKRIVQGYWQQYEHLGKWALFQQPAVERIIHDQVDNWISQMKSRLNSRNNIPGNTRDIQFTERRI